MLTSSALIHFGLIYFQLNLPFAAQIRRTAEEISANMKKYDFLAIHFFFVPFVIFWFMCSVHIFRCVFITRSSVSAFHGVSQCKKCGSSRASGSETCRTCIVTPPVIEERMCIGWTHYSSVQTVMLAV